MSTLGLGLSGSSTPDPHASYRVEVAAAKAGIKRGASWFDWIAAASVINSVISLFSGTWHFVLGLGITEFVDYEAERGGSSRGQMVGFAVTLIVATFFWLMGRFAKQGARWALIVGMFLYLLDGGLLLMGQDWFSAAFHAYALFMLAKTFGAIKQYEAAKQNAEAHGVFLDTVVG